MSTLLQLADLEVTYPHFKFSLSTLQIEAGEVIAVLGPNGSGKSTFLKGLAGLLDGHQTDGHYVWQGITPTQLSDKIAYVPATFTSPFSVSVWDAVLMGRLARGRFGKLPMGRAFQYATPHDSERAMIALERVGIARLRTRDLLELSSGERQLVLLARSLMQGAKLILLDEALSHLDLHYQARLGRLIEQMSKEGCAFLIVDHDFNLATEWATRAIFLKEGKVLCDGKLAEVLTEQTLKQIYPQTNFVFTSHPTSGRPKLFFQS